MDHLPRAFAEAICFFCLANQADERIAVHGREKVLIFDRDEARRASISRMLSSERFHAEPCHDVSDYRLDFPATGLVLVHDGGDAIHEVTTHVKSQGLWLPVLAYDTNPLLAKVVRAMNGGAVDYLEWPFDSETFAGHIAMLDDRFAFLRQLRARENRMRDRWHTLSRREQEVLDAMGEGSTNAEIAAELSISPRTVEIHRLNAIRKLGAQRTADAIRIMVEARLAGIAGEPDRLSEVSERDLSA